MAARKATRDADATRKRVTKACAYCGIEFTASDANVQSCSASCAQKRRCAEGRGRRTHETPEQVAAAELDRWQRKNRRRRALKRGAVSERYSLVEIAARDRHRCKLCGKRVAMKIRVPNLMAPTIDHVIPISSGGDDTKANVQLAHFSCNSRKSNRGSAEQLALV